MSKFNRGKASSKSVYKAPSDSNRSHGSEKKFRSNSMFGLQADTDDSTPPFSRPPSTAIPERQLLDVSEDIILPDLSSLVEKLTDEQLMELHECFTMFDVDGSGSVDFHELGRILLSLGQKLSDEDLRQMISEVDVNGSGDVDFAEFCALMGWQMFSCGEEQQLRQIFESLVDSSTKQLPKAHLRFVLANTCPLLPVEDVDDILATMRGDSLTFKQFYNIFQETRPNALDAMDIKFAAGAELMYNDSTSM